MNTKVETKVITSISLRPEVVRAVAKEAKRTGLSRSAVIESALEFVFGLKKEKK